MAITLNVPVKTPVPLAEIIRALEIVGDGPNGDADPRRRAAKILKELASWQQMVLVCTVDAAPLDPDM